MPSYVFKCDCGERDERFFPMADIAKQPAVKCSKCGQEMKQLIGIAAIKWNCTGSTK
jgi:putative FmdB family regulatory protein